MDGSAGFIAPQNSVGPFQFEPDHLRTTSKFNETSGSLYPNEENLAASPSLDKGFSNEYKEFQFPKRQWASSMSWFEDSALSPHNINRTYKDPTFTEFQQR